MGEALFIVAGWMAFGTVLIAWVYRETLLAFWREPVLKRPVLIVESDDWGPAGDDDAVRLERLAGLLRGYRDRRGRSVVLTLGIVLALPDARRIAADGGYHRILLTDERSSAVLHAIRSGVDAGVFSVQLHGMEHYWPEALMAAAAHDQNIRAWLASSPWPSTEALPSALQSRWIDASMLPSRPLSVDQINAAVAEEMATFAAIFGEAARVVVPPTFVWDGRVETAWAAAGAKIVVTPGARYVRRDAQGALVRDGPRLYNGMATRDGLRYVVRDDYFEPSKGHRAERALDALKAKIRLGRPTLLETHRLNFVGHPAAANIAFDELARAFDLVLQRFPDVVFLSTRELVEHIEHRDPDLIECGIARRLHIWLVRSSAISRLVKLAWLTGIVLPAWLLLLATRPAQDPTAATP